jgi:hypothetical protein
MRVLCAGLVVSLITLSACTGSDIDRFFGRSEARNASMDDECRHAGSQGTGYVVNCSSRNDDRHDDIERPC